MVHIYAETAQPGAWQPRMYPARAHLRSIYRFEARVPTKLRPVRVDVLFLPFPCVFLEILSFN